MTHFRIIKNSKQLGTTLLKKQSLEILEAGLHSAMPKNFIKKYVKKNYIKTKSKNFIVHNYEKIYLISFGKGADTMAKSVDSILKIKGGIVVIPKGSKSVITKKKFKIIKSGHPIPDQASVFASQSILDFLKKRNKKDLVIFLISGGGSSLLSLPLEITLGHKKSITKELLTCGASISEINCVRKHLSLIKGGRLVENLNCDGVALVMSDVEGDDLSSISSGCTYFDSSTFLDALKVIKKYHLQKKIPKIVLKKITEGIKKKIPETPKEKKIENQIIASNKDCLKTMTNYAKRLGYDTKILTIFDDVEITSEKIVKKISQKSKSCLIFGGEPTVQVKGKGKGGRNQELVLRILEKIQNTKKNLTVCSIGTDGIDGNTKYAGAIIQNIPVSDENICKYLRSSNSNLFFKKYGGLIRTGYTHTNLLDVGLILKP